MRSDANTISSTLSRMEARGLITRSTNEQDHRASRVRLSRGGRSKLEKVLPLALAYQERVLRALPEDHQAKFLEELELIADACARMLDKPPSSPPRSAG